MIYTCSNGCLFYYDRILYRWSLADPTMLFLLGLDAILSGNSSLVSNYINISKEYSDPSSNEPIPYRYFEIYDKIYSYLSDIGTVEDLDSYLRFDCNGLKLLMNDLTGTGSDRTVPVLFNNDINRRLIDITKQSYRIPDSERINLSYYDIQAIIINSIFEDAGYSGDPTDILTVGTSRIPIATIKSHNEVRTEVNDERIDNSNIFKLLDFKSMYSYALGVLYGCRCLGYNSLFIWRTNPSSWYNGELKNLVSTAWSVFRFYKCAYIDEFEEDPDLSVKYQSIAYNKLWNFDDSITKQSLQSNPIMIDEVESYIFNIRPYDSDIVDQFSSPDESLTSYLVQSSPTFYSKRLLGDSSSVSDILFNPDNSSIKCVGSNIPINGNFVWRIKLNANDVTQKTYDATTNAGYIDISGSTVIEQSAHPDPIGESKTLIQDLIDCKNGILNEDPSAIVRVTAEVVINESAASSEITIISSDNDLTSCIVSPGKYLIINNDNLQWNNMTTLLNDPYIRYGIVSKLDLDNPIIRYIGSDPIIIYPAYKWDSYERFECYLGPYFDYPSLPANYFVPTGAVGWINFDILSILHQTDLSLVPVEFSALDQSKIHETNDHSAFYYECSLGSRISSDSDEEYCIYGIFDTLLTTDSTGKYLFNNASNHFKYILSKDLFIKYYGLQS